MTAVVDNLIAVRILYLLVLPFNKWEAFKEGIIDDEGARTEKDADSDNWSMLHRLVARLKVLLGKFPGGKSVIASMAAAYLLVRECVERDVEPALLEDYFVEALNSNETITLRTYTMMNNALNQIEEELGGAPTNAVGTGQIAGAGPTEDPPVKRKKKVMKRNDLSTLTNSR